MGAQRKESFVLIYSDDSDPSAAETAAALNILKRFAAEEIIPGTIRVIGDRDNVLKTVHNKLDHWEVSNEKQFELNPPYKSKMW
ncbi:hypothetical protein [Sinorhizobium meliloti]|uniref:hypothetical protein n=1 Tax=Rhizobium meliloti TaxID=382 RepID=UPI00040BEEC4|nr:hypothetical protein [Sinorhizobium meliloti]MDE4618398.1 hypothetical protein [Sinorhizobium meliloti]